MKEEEEGPPENNIFSGCRNCLTISDRYGFHCNYKRAGLHRNSLMPSLQPPSPKVAPTNQNLPW